MPCSDQFGCTNYYLQKEQQNTYSVNNRNFYASTNACSKDITFPVTSRINICVSLDNSYFWHLYRFEIIHILQWLAIEPFLSAGRLDGGRLQRTISILQMKYLVETRNRQDVSLKKKNSFQQGSIHRFQSLLVLVVHLTQRLIHPRFLSDKKKLTSRFQ